MVLNAQGGDTGGRIAGKGLAMYRIFRRNRDNIEICMWGRVSEEEYHQMLQEIKSLCSGCKEINVIVDASHVEGFDFKIGIEEYGFVRKNVKRLKRMAVATDAGWKKPFVNWFSRYSRGEFKSFGGKDTEKARQWVFDISLN